MTKKMRDLVREAAETNMTLFDLTSNDAMFESIEELRKCGVSDERILDDLMALAAVDKLRFN